MGSNTHMKMIARVAIALALLSVAMAQVQLETPRLTQRAQRTEFNLPGPNSAFKFKYSAVPVGASRVDNAAGLQLQMDKASNPFLSTLPINGAAQLLTLVKPCGIILPHVHQRATEFYSILFGTMNAGIAQENGGLQNITFTAKAGEVFIVPQGLLHYNHNDQCKVNAFFQSFNSADPGALTVGNAFNAFRESGPEGRAAIIASSAVGVERSAFGAFGLDQACLARCGFPATGAPQPYAQVPAWLKVMFGI